MTSRKRQPSTSARFPGELDPSDPLLGARLRYGLNHVEHRLGQALAEAGFTDIHLSHFKVLRFPPPEGERPIDLARRAGMTKQAMNYLLAQLEESGYIRRTGAPGSSARLVSLTEKGWQVAKLQRATMREIMREWAQQVGEQRFETFYAVLKELVDVTPWAQAERAEAMRTSGLDPDIEHYDRSRG